MNVRSILLALWVSSICAVAALHFVHLQADFPNYSRWMDWSKYTDEGWYANAAIEHSVRGSWYVPGDFNVAAAVPIWPLLVGLLFHITGVGITAARALAVSLSCVNLLLAYFLVRRGQPRWVTLLSLSLMATSSFLYCFSRLALLEPLLVALTFSGLLLARYAGEVNGRRARYVSTALLGAMFCAMVLTKTTAVFLLPAVLYSLWHPLRAKPGEFLSAAAFAGVTAATLWGSYYFFIVRPRYLVDFHYFFHVNIYPKPATLSGWLTTGYYAAHGILWVQPWIAIAGGLMLAATLVFARSAWANPVFVSSILGIAGYVLFVVRIVNMQPRYYVVVAYFLFLLVPLCAEALLPRQRFFTIGVLIFCVAGAARSLWETGGFILYPEYTFVNAARGIAAYIDAHPNGNRVLLSVSGNTISLMTRLPSLCDEFGTMPLDEKLTLYRPGWYAAWNDLDPGILEDLQSGSSLEKVASFAALDDDDRDTLILYKLMPHPSAP